MNSAIIDLLDRELPQLRGTERDELAAKIAQIVGTHLGCKKCRERSKRGRK